jgi:hypothetical protein
LGFPGNTERKKIMDTRLEALSDMVRKGIPIGIGEALEVIDYQARLRLDRADKWNKTIIGRIVNFCKPNAEHEPRKEGNGGE